MRVVLEDFDWRGLRLVRVLPTYRRRHRARDKAFKYLAAACEISPRNRDFSTHTAVRRAALRTVNYTEPNAKLEVIEIRAAHNRADIRFIGIPLITVKI